jgi:phosphate transport system permease protein
MRPSLQSDIEKSVARNKSRDKLFAVLGLLSTLLGMITLAVLLSDLAIDGLARLKPHFFTSFPSRFPSQAGILSSWVGTILVMIVTALAAVPIGIGAGLYLEEYAPKNWITAIIEINIANLAGVPSIVYGLMALGLFVYQFRFGQSIISAGLTLALLILPIVIVATRESVRAVPGSMREAAYALGATKWQTTSDHVLPYSMGGILTGVIIALSRAIGETAPLITIGALTFIAFLPDSPIKGEFPFISFDWLWSPYSVMPIQMFNWVSRPQAEFHLNAAATGLVLMVMTLMMNAIAIYFRHRYRKRIKW